MRILIGVGQGGDGWFWKFTDECSGDLEEDELAGFGLWFGTAAEIAGGDSVAEDICDGIVGVELGTGAAVGVHVREDADDACSSRVHDDDAVFVGGHLDGPDLVYLE